MQAILAILSLFIVAIVITIKVVLIWFFLSLGVSGVKKMSHDCGSAYPTDGIFYSKFFCPEDKDGTAQN